MIFGGLSEKELELITNALTSENVEYEVKTDSHIIDSNKESMQYNLRHLSSPSISTHILAVEISDDAFKEMSDDLKSKLLDLGITNEVPEDFEVVDMEEISTIHDEQLKGNKRVIGFNFLYTVILGVVIMILSYFFGPT